MLIVVFILFPCFYVLLIRMKLRDFTKSVSNVNKKVWGSFCELVRRM